jgi:hypothetical protein
MKRNTRLRKQISVVIIYAKKNTKTAMSPIQIRTILFLIGCIGTRLLLAYIAKIAKPQLLQYLGYIALVISAGFLYIYFTGSRQTGPEVLGGRIWWNDLRPVHAFLYGLFAYHAISRHANAWIYLFIDVVVGLVAFTMNRIGYI